jgi:hypothetical protein
MLSGASEILEMSPEVDARPQAASSLRISTG